ncbi:MAG: SdpI family protein [Halobacteriota archaeon]|nr:SdpI family protein [Halobacteriota archaeon]
MFLIGLSIGALITLVAVMGYFLAPKIGPNPWFGVRIGYTFIDRGVWDEVNRYAGKLLTIVGVFLMILSLFLEVDPADQEKIAETIIIFAIVMICLCVLVLIRIYLRSAYMAEELDGRKTTDKTLRRLEPLEIHWIYGAAPIIAFLALVLLLFTYYAELPQEMASRFDLNGNPVVWMDKGDYMALYLVASLSFPTMALIIMRVGVRYPMYFYPGFINIKREDYIRVTCLIAFFTTLDLFLIQAYIIFINISETFPAPSYKLLIESSLFVLFIPIIWLTIHTYQVRRENEVME